MKKSILMVMSLLMLAAILAACGPTVTPAPTTLPPTPAAPTATVVVAAPTSAPPTAVPPTAIAPTAVPPTPTTVIVSPTAPPAPTEPPANRIRFAEGATSALVNGSVAAEGIERYVLKASAGQLLEIDLSAPEDAVRLQIWGADGDVLMSGAARASGYRGVLRSTQDYYIAVIGNIATSYSLFVRIPERIVFAAGSTSAVREGRLVPGDSHAYVLHAAAGQWMDVTLSAPTDAARIVIYGLDGTVLVSGMGDQTVFRGVLPVTEDYILIVHGNATVSYSLHVLIPERVTFSPGAVSAERSGTLAANDPHTFVLDARAGQMLEVHVAAPAGAVRLAIWGADGSTLLSGFGADYGGPLTVTQDWFIGVDANQPVRYTIEFRITG